MVWQTVPNSKRWQLGKLGRRKSTAAYGAQPEMVTRPNVVDVEPRRLPSGGVWLFSCCYSAAEVFQFSNFHDPEVHEFQIFISSSSSTDSSVESLEKFHEDLLQRSGYSTKN